MIRNFLFHRVNPKRDELWDPMDVELFDKCIKYISSKYEVVLFEDLAFDNKMLNSKNKIATIMFDDGYKDNIDFAFPILEKYNIKASFYVVTNCIDNNTPTWTYILDYSFNNTKINGLNIDFEFIPKELHVLMLNTKKKRLSYAKQLKPFLKSLHFEKRQQVLERVSNTYIDVEIPKLMMNWEDIKKLKNHGHYIGSHTVSHNMLGTMTREADVIKELIDSKRIIEEKIGESPITISYPIGSFTEVTKRLSIKAGYKIGLAVKQSIYNPKEEDLFEVSRIELYNESWWKTKLRISNVLEDLKKIIKYR